MAGKLSRGPLGRLLTFLVPPWARLSTRFREKQLILLVLCAFSFLCFGAIWFLPEKSGVGGKVKIVSDLRKNVQEAVEGIVLPPPPAESFIGGNPNIKHGVIDRPDPHKLAELENLHAQIELDEEIERIRNKIILSKSLSTHIDFFLK